MPRRSYPIFRLRGGLTAYTVTDSLGQALGLPWVVVLVLLAFPLAVVAFPISLPLYPPRQYLPAVALQKLTS
jgi:hypothetical protein